MRGRGRVGCLVERTLMSSYVVYSELYTDVMGIMKARWRYLELQIVADKRSVSSHLSAAYSISSLLLVFIPLGGEFLSSGPRNLRGANGIHESVQSSVLAVQPKRSLLSINVTKATADHTIALSIHGGSCSCTASAAVVAGLALGCNRLV